MDPLIRYSCQILLPGFGEAGQQRLQQSRVLVVGAGGLGCPAALYLAASGLGLITLADFDTVSAGNLHRQVLFTPEEVGLLKAEVACEKLQRQNPLIRLVPFTGKIHSANVRALVAAHDVVVDCTDNFETRYLLNDACVLEGKPLVYGAIYQYEGQVAVWNVLNDDGSRSPNYRDVFPEVDGTLIPDCAEGGVMPALAGIIGSMQANEVIKLQSGIGVTLAGSMFLLETSTMQSRLIAIGKTTGVTITSLEPTVNLPALTVEDLVQHLDDGFYELVDVRTAEERNRFSLGGLHVPMEVLEENLDRLPHHKPLLFYCASGKRSAEAVKRFHRHFPSASAYTLEGGVKAWTERAGEMAETTE